MNCLFCLTLQFDNSRLISVQKHSAQLPLVLLKVYFCTVCEYVILTSPSGLPHLHGFLLAKTCSAYSYLPHAWVPIVKCDFFLKPLSHYSIL